MQVYRKDRLAMFDHFFCKYTCACKMEHGSQKKFKCIVSRMIKPDVVFILGNESPLLVSECLYQSYQIFVTQFLSAMSS